MAKLFNVPVVVFLKHSTIQLFTYSYYWVPANGQTESDLV